VATGLEHQGARKGRGSIPQLSVEIEGPGTGVQGRFASDPRGVQFPIGPLKFCYLKIE